MRRRRRSGRRASGSRLRAWKGEGQRWQRRGCVLFRQPVIRTWYGLCFGNVCLCVHVLQVRSSLSIMVLSSVTICLSVIIAARNLSFTQTYEASHLSSLTPVVPKVSLKTDTKTQIFICLFFFDMLQSKFHCFWFISYHFSMYRNAALCFKYDLIFFLSLKENQLFSPAGGAIIWKWSLIAHSHLHFFKVNFHYFIIISLLLSQQLLQSKLCHNLVT